MTHPLQVAVERGATIVDTVRHPSSEAGALHEECGRWRLVADDRLVCEGCGALGWLAKLTSSHPEITAFPCKILGESGEPCAAPAVRLAPVQRCEAHQRATRRRELRRQHALEDELLACLKGARRG